MMAFSFVSGNMKFKEREGEENGGREGILVMNMCTTEEGFG